MISAVGYDAGISQMSYASSNSYTSMEKVFTSLSMATGGDGKSLSKSQLSNYIKNVQQDEVSLSKDKLEVLKNMEKEWGKLFGNEEKVSVKELQKNSNKNIPLFVDDSTNSIEFAEQKIKFYKEKNKEFQEFLEKIKTELKEEAKNRIENQKQTKEEVQAKTQAKTEENGITKKDLKIYLNAILQKEPQNKDEEIENSNDIHHITNLIAEFDELTGGKEVMTSFEKKTQYTV